MKKVDAYVFGSLVRTFFQSALLITLMIVLFDVFSNLDQYLRNEIGYVTIIRLSVLFLPQAAVYAIGPAALFSTTYFLSMLHANNEMIILSNIGYPYRRVVLPIVVLGLLLAGTQFLISEQLAIPASVEKKALGNEALQVRELNDNRNVTLQSPDGSYILHAARYYESSKRITGVTLIVMDRTGKLQARIDAASGTFNGSWWEFKDANRYLLDLDGQVMDAQRLAVYHNESVNLEPALFRNLQADITTMELGSALRYIRRIQVMDANQYAIQASDFYHRILGNLTPLILILISCSTVFTWRKNVLMLSILASLAIAVVFFVMQMVSMIFAKQGIYGPEWGPLAPIVALLCVSGAISLVRRI